MREPFSEWKRARQIILDRRAADAIDAAADAHDAFSAIWYGLEWFLARNPGTDLSRRRIVGDKWYLIYSDVPPPYTLSVSVLYSFTNQAVTIHNVLCEEIIGPVGTA